MSSHITDDELLSIYRLGMAGGSASTMLSLGRGRVTVADAKTYAFELVSAAYGDPAARHEILTNVRAVLEGKPHPEHTELGEVKP